MGFLSTPASQCCPTSAGVTIGPIGPQGAAGAAGTNGADGSDAYTLTTAGYSQPAIGASVTVDVADSTWMVAGQVIYVQSGGYYTCTSKPNATSVVLTNLGYAGNAAPAAAIANTRGVSPGGLIGTTGATGIATFNGVSPTTTKGDLIVDDGTNTPLANNIRLTVGTNGKALVANSAVAAGVAYATITPNTTTDNGIPRYDGATGVPVPLQTSNLIISDTGAIQSTPSGGNARGASATDLQVVRAGATQVASGANSVVAGGENNIASGAHSTVAGGKTNTASGQYATVAGGTDNVASAADSTVGGGIANTATDVYATIGGGSGSVASADYATVGGGNSNTASQNYATVAGGQSNVASGVHSTVAGGRQNTASGLYASVVGGNVNLASGERSVVLQGGSVIASHYGQVTWGEAWGVAGDSQASSCTMTTYTTDATQTELFLDSSIATLRFTINTSRMVGFLIYTIGRRDNGDCAMWKTEGSIKNNAGTTALIGAGVATTLIAADAGCSGTWGVAGSVVVDADNGNDALRIRVTGTAVNTIHWVSRLELVEASTP